MLRLGFAQGFGWTTLAAMGFVLVGCMADAEPTTDDDAQSIGSEVKGGKGGGKGGGGGTSPTPTGVSCSSMNGRTVTADWVTETVSMNAGQKLTARVSPARDGDAIILTSSLGLAITFSEAPATTGLVFVASTGGTYNFGWSLEAAGTRPSSITWTFSCS